MFANLNVDRLSFWIGFLAGGLFLFFIRLLRPALPKFYKAIRERVSKTRQSMEAGIDFRFRRDILRYAQQQHLGSPLFALDEILVKPRLLAPPLRTQPENEDILEDIISLTLPYTPDWPELAAWYGAPELDIVDVLDGGANLLLLGNPGSGKTVALAYLASILARYSAEAGKLSNHLPVFIHAAALPPQTEEGSEIIAPIAEALTGHLSPLTLPRLGNFLRESFESGKVLVLLDGLDELPQEKILQTGQYLQALLSEYPKIRLVAAGSSDYYDGLVALGLAPVFLAGWDHNKKANFVHQWGVMWREHIQRDSTEENKPIDGLLLDRWLSVSEAAANPLELTLKVWSAYAGDLTGPDTLNLIDVYIQRMTTDITGVRPVLERIASNAIKKGTCTFSLAEAGKWVYGNGAIPEIDLDETLQAYAPDLIENNETQELAQEENEVPSEQDVEADDFEAIDVKEEALEISAGRRAIHPLVSAGLLIARKSNRFSLVHPVVAAYLAGSSMAADGSWRTILEQPDWTVKILTLRYCAAWVDLSSIAEPVLKKQTDPTTREEISIWNWLRVAPKTARWRAMVMRKLAGVLQDENLPLNLRGRALAALFCSRDPGTSVLFRQLLAHPHFSVKQLAALGCGLTLDSKAVPELITLSEDPSSNVRRAALMALGVIGTKPALDAVAVALLQGSDDSRRAAAEIFAYNLEEGHPALRDGSTMDDMLVRRAVVHGLVRVNQPWSTEILERMQLEDKQWIVRTAAAHAVEALQRPEPHIPQPYLPLPQTPWLIVFAGKLGMGVSPGKPAVEMLYRAISSGEPREKLAALDHIIVHGNEQAVPYIYEILFGCEGELQEAAYNALWFLAGSGIQLPPPAHELRS